MFTGVACSDQVSQAVSSYFESLAQAGKVCKEVGAFGDSKKSEESGKGGGGFRRVCVEAGVLQG